MCIMHGCIRAIDSVNSFKCSLKTFFVPLTICIDQTRRALVIVLPCYGALEIVGVIIIIIIITEIWSLKYFGVTTLTFWGHVTSSIT